MQAIVYDPTHTTLLTSISGTVTDSEWQNLHDSILRIAEDSRRLRSQTFILSFSAPGTSRPNATWRKKLAETRYVSDKSLRSYFVLVTSSALLRGVMIAINWVTPKSDTEENHVADSFEAAYAWLQKMTGQPLLHIPGMYQELRQKVSGFGGEHARI
jgi:hypothetical protein